LAKFN